jgi:tetratricopeptide (TPR) repeat protein
MDAGHEAREAEAGSPWEAIGVACIGLAHVARGEWDEGRGFMAEYARISEAFGTYLNQASGLSTVAACDAELAEWEAAEAAAAAALAIAADHGIDEHWCMAHAHLARGLASERRGDAAVAIDALRRARAARRRPGVRGLAAGAPRACAGCPRRARRRA